MPLKPHPTDPDKMVYESRKYDLPKREWVGLTELDCVGWFGYDTGVGAWFETNKGDDDSIPLYKEPPQREWVGLKDDDEIPWDGVDAKSFARAIEAKLKEKNT